MFFDAGVFIAVAALVVLTTPSFFPDYKSGWEGWEPCPSKIRKVELIDGTMAKYDLMRRKVNGCWEYRKMTKQEAAQSMADPGAL